MARNALRPAPNEGFREFNFTNPGYIATVVIMGEELEINMFEVRPLVIYP